MSLGEERQRFGGTEPLCHVSPSASCGSSFNGRIYQRTWERRH